MDDLELCVALTSTDKLRREIQAVREEARDFARTANDAEQHGRRKNLRIRGLPLKSGEDCKQAVLVFCHQMLHAPLSDDDIEIVHILPIRTSDNQTASAKSEVNPIIVRFHSQEVRKDIIIRQKTLKGTKFSIAEDLTALNMSTLNRLHKDVAIDKTWYWNGRLFVSTKNNHTLLVKPFQTLQECVVIS